MEKLCLKNYYPFILPTLSALFLFYLAATSNPIFIHDSTDYDRLSQIFLTGGWQNYFQTGPNREPLYPLFIMLAKNIAPLVHCPFVTVLLILQILTLLTAQLLLIALLNSLGISAVITCIISAYLVLSPNILTSSLVVFSEILVYPLILALMLLLSQALQIIGKKNTRPLIIKSILIGLAATLLVLVKGFFEVVMPLFLLALLPVIYFRHKKDQRASVKRNYLILVLIIAGIFYSTLFTFKVFNKIYNNNFVYTNRGSVMLYGNMVRNTTNIMGPPALSAILDIVPDKSFCRSLTGTQACAYWDSMISDDIGFRMADKLQLQKMTPDQINRRLSIMAIEQAARHPLEAVFISSLHGIKFFFWEFFSPSFTSIPGWVEKVYGFRPLYYFLLFGVPLMSLVAFFSALGTPFQIPSSGDDLKMHQRNLMSTMIVTFLGIFITIHALVAFVSERYALQLAPLFLILIALYLDKTFCQHSSKKA